MHITQELSIVVHVITVITATLAFDSFRITVAIQIIYRIEIDGLRETHPKYKNVVFPYGPLINPPRPLIN